MSETGPKSAFEVAMERLRRKDEDEGTVQQRLSEAQKAAIAEARNICEARIAELEVMHKSALGRTFEPAARDELEAGYRRERERVTSERDAKIERIRRGEDGGQSSVVSRR
jgi:hypothetical protein